VKIVIPSWHCPEVADLLLLTVFLVVRTFLSVYLATVNGRIVQAIIEQNLSLFIKRVKSRVYRSSDWDWWRFLLPL
jgi:ATP-binding cassette, subfamily D (ALD), member 3